MTFRITDWHPPIDGVARAESRYDVIDGFGASGACRRAHRHDGADEALSGAISPPLPSAPSRRHQWFHLLPLPSNRCAASRRHRCDRDLRGMTQNRGMRICAPALEAKFPLPPRHYEAYGEISSAGTTRAGD